MWTDTMGAHVYNRGGVVSRWRIVRDADVLVQAESAGMGCGGDLVRAIVGPRPSRPTHQSPGRVDGRLFVCG